MVVEDVVSNLSAAFDPGAVVMEDGAASVHVRPLRTGMGAARMRQAIVAPPPSRLRFRVQVPPRAVLHFGSGVEPAPVDGRPPEPRGIRFTVAVDGRLVFERTVDPVAGHHDCHWLDERVELDGEERRDIEVELATEVAGPGSGLVGVPGWSHVRVVREGVRDRQPASDGAPNVLVLLVDTLRAERLGCYGAPVSPSPTLDRLAQGGLLFESAIAQASWTLPSVATLFTGLHPRSHGVAGLPEESHAAAQAADRHEDTDPAYLSDGLPTLAAQAQRAGITTVGISTNPLVSRGTNLARGFESFLELRWNEGQRRAGEVNDLFLEWLAHNGEHRFLAYLHYMDIHAPYQPPASFRPQPPAGVRAAVVAGDLIRMRKISLNGRRPLTEAELDYVRSLYDGQIRYWDAELARLLEGLAAAGVAERTVVIVLSDHGEEFLDHGWLGHGPHLYDEAIRVPLIIHGPGIARRKVARQAQGIDLFPTVAALLGLPAVPGLPGTDLLALLDDRPAVSQAGNDVVSVRTPQWKLIRDAASGTIQLFDLAADPGERQDRAADASRVAALLGHMERWESAVPLPPPVTGRDQAVREKLQALGYVE
jgi:arylsulfatase A-like enzyme